MNKKIDLETLVAFINNELSESEYQDVSKKINEDKDVKQKYENIKKTREMHTLYMQDFLNEKIPEKTNELFKQYENSKNFFTSLLNKWYVTLTGWLGFLVTGAILLPVYQMQVVDKGNETLIADLQNSQNSIFRSADLNRIELNQIIVIEDKYFNQYEIKITEITSHTKQICFSFSIRSADENKEDFQDKKICID